MGLNTAFTKKEAKKLKKGERVRLVTTFNYEGDPEENNEHDEGIRAQTGLGTVDETYDESDDALYIMWDGYQGLWTHHNCLGPEIEPVSEDEEAAAIASILGGG